MITIKPHHFIDIITSFGTGQRTFEPHPYGHDVHTVSQQILDDGDTLLEMELGADDICKPCIHNIDGSCDDTIDISFRPQAPLLIDQRWCERLGISQGNRFSARDFCQRIRDKMGDITDIYREVSADRTKKRQTNLMKGLEYYLKHRIEET
jgi:hypothetical protein